MIALRSSGIVVQPDSTRVLLRAFNPTNEQRSMKILARIMTLPPEKVASELAHVLTQFERSHRFIKEFFLKRYEQVKSHLLTDASPSYEQKLLIGSYFTLEYALESTALFNPSMVWHPDQSGLPASSRRFILSLRATGEGHISSITFRTGVLDAVSRLTLETPTKFVTAPELVVNSMYDLELFERNLFEMGHSDEFTGLVLAGLNVQFTMEELKASIHVVEQQQHRKRDAAAILSYSNLLTLAKANYTAYYSEEVPLSERVLFPTSPTEINGIEDARFVRLPS